MVDVLLDRLRHAPHHVANEWADKYKGKFDDGLGQATARRRFERQKKLGDRPAGHRAHRAPRPLPGLGLAHRHAEEALRPPDGGLRRLLGERRLERRPAARRRSRRWATSTTRSIFYIWGDNGASMEGTITGSFNEMTFLNGVVLDADQQLELIEQYGGIEALGGDAHRAALSPPPGRTPCNTPFQWGKQIGQPPRRHPQPDGRRVAEPHQGRPAIRAQFTHCIDIGPTDPRGRRHPRAEDRRRHRRRSRWTARASCYTFDDADAAERHTVAVLRDVRQPRHVQGRLVGVRRGPTGSRGTSRRRRSRSSGPDADWDPDSDVAGSSTTCPTTSRRRTTSPPSTPTRSRSCRSCGGRRPSATGCCRCMGGMSVIFGILPPLPTITRFTFAGDVQNVQRGMVPRIYGRSYAIEADLARARGRRRGRDRRQRRLHRRLRAVGRRERARSTTPTRSSASRPTSRCRPSRSRPAT